MTNNAERDEPEHGLSTSRIFIHDYSGHAFPTQLSRSLASRGHTVCHAYSFDIEAPRGNLETDGDKNLTILPVSTGRALSKYNLPKRFYQEADYAKRLGAEARKFQPDIILSGNASPWIQRQMLRTARQMGVPFISWVQDIYSVAFSTLLKHKIPLIGGIGGAILRAIEFGAISDSDAAVVISDDFTNLLAEGSVPREKITVIENWASTEEINPRPRENDWAREHGLAGKFVFLYSGTLGLKHDPSILSGLAAHFKSNPDVRLVVISQGLGREWLEKEKTERGLENLILMDYVPYADLPEALASGDVLVCILEPSAGVLSVPSKILSYICAGRPLLAAIPGENLAARIITGNKIGLVSEPGDKNGFIAAGDRLYAEQELREQGGKSAIAYAGNTFDIGKITDRFEHLFAAVLK